MTNKNAPVPGSVRTRDPFGSLREGREDRLGRKESTCVPGRREGGRLVPEMGTSRTNSLILLLT